MKIKKIENCRNKKGFIDLNNLESYREKGEIVDGSNAKAWFKVDGVRFLFKEYDSVLPAFGEVLYSKVARKHNIDCAEYDFACYDGKIGTISYDFLSDDKVYYNCLELTTQFIDTKFTIDEMRENRELLAIHNNRYNNMNSIKEVLSNLFNIGNDEKKIIEKKLIEMVTLDTIFWHRDRTLWNYGVVVDENSDQMTFAPIHDNSWILYLEKGEQYIEEMVASLISGSKLDGLNDYNSSFNMGTEKDDAIDQLVKFYSLSDDETREIIENIVNNIDIEDEVEKLNEICKIDDVSRLWIKTVSNYRRITILKGLESVKIDDSKAMKPNVSFSKRK